MTSTQIRDELQELVLRDLLGPADGPEEIVAEVSVRDRYLVGRLAPKGQSALPEEVDDAPEAGVDGEDGTTEAPPSRASKASSTMSPSSIGMTFAIGGQARALRVIARWGRYRRIERKPSEEREKPPAPGLAAHSR